MIVCPMEVGRCKINEANGRFARKANKIKRSMMTSKTIFQASQRHKQANKTLTRERVIEKR